MAYLLYAFALTALALPGVALARWREAWPAWPRLILHGTVLGLGLALAAAFALAWLGRLSLFWWLWLPLAGAALAYLLWPRPPVPPPAPITGVYVRAERPLPAWPLALVLGLVGVSRAVPIFWHSVPPGWDPSFHLILLDKVWLAKGLVYDWQPFGGHQLNYPLGPHVLLAALRQFSGLSSPAAFMWLFPILGVLATGQVFVLARTLSHGQRVALAAAAAYGLLANYGSIGYFGWGGLPNALGMVLLVEAVTLIAAPAPGPLAAPRLGILLAGLTLAHHHVMLVGGVVVAVLWLAALGQRHWRQRTVLIWAASAFALMLAGLHVIPYAGRARQVAGTGVARLNEAFFGVGLLGDSLGWAFAGLILGGAWLGLRRQTPPARWRDWSWVTGALLGLFVVLSYGWRYYSRWRYGQDWVAFTPSRLLTDVAPLLAVLAGVGLWRLWTWRAWPRWALIVASGLLLASTWSTWRPLFKAGATPAELAAFGWIREHLPPQTAVLAENHWAAWAAWRPASSLPLHMADGTPPADDFLAVFPHWLSGARPIPSDLTLVVVGPAGKMRPEFARLWQSQDGTLEIRAIHQPPDARPGQAGDDAP